MNVPTEWERILSEFAALELENKVLREKLEKKTTREQPEEIAESVS